MEVDRVKGDHKGKGKGKGKGKKGSFKGKGRDEGKQRAGASQNGLAMPATELQFASSALSRYNKLTATIMEVESGRSK